MSIQFPDPDSATAEGLVWIGGELTTENLIAAYSRGIFPWPQPHFPITWFCPNPRGVLEFRDFHVPKKMLKQYRNSGCTYRINTAFEQVIEQCSKVPRADGGTWITSEMVSAYIKLHQKGIAHSVEVYKEDKLVGGLYGVDVLGVFSGESMFFVETGASKLALVHLVEVLKSAGREWIDIQMVTPVLKQFGGKYISRAEFLKMLKGAQKSDYKEPFKDLEKPVK